ncbi:unnamed protein product, partial [Prorocentrum cordatum]
MLSAHMSFQAWHFCGSSRLDAGFTNDPSLVLSWRRNAMMRWWNATEPLPCGYETLASGSAAGGSGTMEEDAQQSMNMGAPRADQAATGTGWADKSPKLRAGRAAPSARLPKLRDQRDASEDTDQTIFFVVDDDETSPTSLDQKRTATETDISKTIRGDRLEVDGGHQQRKTVAGNERRWAANAQKLVIGDLRIQRNSWQTVYTYNDIDTKMPASVASSHGGQSSKMMHSVTCKVDCKADVTNRDCSRNVRAILSFAAACAEAGRLALGWLALRAIVQPGADGDPLAAGRHGHRPRQHYPDELLGPAREWPPRRPHHRRQRARRNDPRGGLPEARP